MIPPHLLYQIYLSFLEQNDCTPPEYTESAHTEVEDLSSRCMNGIIRIRYTYRFIVVIYYNTHIFLEIPENFRI